MKRSIITDTTNIQKKFRLDKGKYYRAKSISTMHTAISPFTLPYIPTRARSSSHAPMRSKWCSFITECFHSRQWERKISRSPDTRCPMCGLKKELWACACIRPWENFGRWHFSWQWVGVWGGSQSFSCACRQTSDPIPRYTTVPLVLQVRKHTRTHSLSSTYAQTI